MSENEDQGRRVEDLDDSQMIWPGGPTAGQIKEWKRTYIDVYVTSLTSDKHLVWRPLTRNEYKEIILLIEELTTSEKLTKAQANLWNEEIITKVCLLFPPYDDLGLEQDLAGIPSLLSQEILEASGFVAREVRQL